VDQLIWFALPLLGGLLLFALISAGVRAPGQLLAQKFAALGTLKGRPMQEIVAAVGPPSAQSGAAGGKQVLQWMATGYHIVLRFDAEGVCEGVTHEASV